MPRRSAASILFALFGEALDFNAVSNLFYSATPAVMNFTRTSTERHYKGRLDEVALFDHALTPAQMQWVYNSGLGLPMVELTINPTPTGPAGPSRSNRAPALGRPT
jgi:hypothetical protein